MTTTQSEARVVSSNLELGEIIRGARKAAGLTQAQLATDSGVGRQWLVAVEAGSKASPPLDMVLRVLTRLEVMLVLVPVGAQGDPD